MERFDLSYKPSIFHISHRAQKDVSGFQKFSYTGYTSWAASAQQNHRAVAEAALLHPVHSKPEPKGYLHLWFIKVNFTLFCDYMDVFGIRNKVAQERCC